MYLLFEMQLQKPPNNNLCHYIFIATALEAFLKLEFRSLTRLIGSDTGGI